MEYIDKTQGALQAHSLLSAFLTRCQDGGFSPNDDLYSKMASDRDPSVPNADTTYNILRRQLLQENNCRCCYCMRNIEDVNTTLEHIIPNRISNQVRYDEYQKFYSRADWQKMIFSKSFLANPRWPFRSFPHTIAYENLIPSCNGKFAKNISGDIHAHDDRVSKCCNNKRGEEFVIPFVLNQQMVNEFEYKRNGYVIWPVVDTTIRGEARKKLLFEHKRTIDILNLNCLELVTIRRIWFFLAITQSDCATVDKDRVILDLTDNENLTSEEITMLQNFWYDNYWCLLEEYRYFNDINKFK
jgi:hypothetical protein